MRQNRISEATCLFVDGKEVRVPPGATILDACLAAGAKVPTLCHHPLLTPDGNCRLCVIEIAGREPLLPACCTPAEEGMQVFTASPRVITARREILRLLLQAHAADCLTCEKNGACRLQEYAYLYGVQPEQRRFLGSGVDTGPFFVRDHGKCVLCGRCVRICREVVGRFVIDFVGHGQRTRIGTAFGQPLAEAGCVSCGNCAEVCPVGALVPHFRRGAGREWELRRVRTVCGYCGAGCNVNLVIRNGRVIGAEGAGGPPNHGLLCVKGRFGHDYVHHPDRLRYPLIRRSGVLKSATWNEALRLVAASLLRCREKHGPDAIAGLGSAKCTNEENYLFQKLFRVALGTNNVDHCARMCHAPSVAGLGLTFGSGAMTNSLEDLEQAACFLVAGSNTTENHPAVAYRMRRALRRGARLLVVDPRRTELADAADIHVRVRPGTDLALFNAMAHVIIQDGLHDQAFIAARTEGFADLAAAVETWPPERAAAVTGVAPEDIRRAATVYATMKPAAIIYAMGITQHAGGTATVAALANLALLTGNVGRPGGGVNPLRGQNNVQGCCDMGVLPDFLPGYRPVADDEARRIFSEAWGVPVPDRPGLRATELPAAVEAGAVRALYVMGENPLVTHPDVARLESALAKLDFLVVQDVFLTETARRADVVLPAAVMAEKCGTVTSTERRVQLVRRAVRPPGQSRSDLKIINDLARLLGAPPGPASPAAVMREVAALVPAYGGISYPRLVKRSLQWPCPREDHPGTPILHTDTFPRGRARFVPVSYIPPAEAPGTVYPYLLVTGRNRYQYHSGSLTRRTALHALAPVPYVELNPATAARLGIEEGEVVRLASPRGSVEAIARLTETVREDELFMPFHYGEAPANRLTGAGLDTRAGTPAFKVSAVRVEKVGCRRA